MPVITSPEWSGSETGGRRYAPFTVNVERGKPWHTLTGRMHFLLDHDWMHEMGETLPIYRVPLDMHKLFGDGTPGELGEDGASVTVRYLTPHSKWSIHSEYQDNLFMLSLSRGGPTVWMSEPDATSIGVRDNDWVEAVNRNGVLVAAGDRHPPDAGGHRVRLPRAGAGGERAEVRGDRAPRRHPQLADPDPGQADPPDRRLRPAVVRVQLPRSDRATSATRSRSSDAGSRRR